MEESGTEGVWVGQGLKVTLVNLAHLDLWESLGLMDLRDLGDPLVNLAYREFLERKVYPDMLASEDLLVNLAPRGSLVLLE